MTQANKPWLLWNTSISSYSLNHYIWIIIYLINTRSYVACKNSEWVKMTISYFVMFSIVNRIVYHQFWTEILSSFFDCAIKWFQVKSHCFIVWNVYYTMIHKNNKFSFSKWTIHQSILVPHYSIMSIRLLTIISQICSCNSSNILRFQADR